MNKKLARDNLLNAVRLVVVGLEDIGIPALKGRDHREPDWLEKERLEDGVRSAIVRHFARQRKKVLSYLQSKYPNRKALDYWDDEEDDDVIVDLVRQLRKAVRNGISLFGKNSKIQIDWTLANTEAEDWAREYVYDLIKDIDKISREALQSTISQFVETPGMTIGKDIDKISREALQSTISQFVETPGMTIGDVIDLLPFDEDRAQRIAVTEITRAYSKADQIAGDKLREEFPDVRVVSTWFTNNDDLVCELCGPLEGTEVEDGNTFYTPDTAYEDGFPPRHVNCRCWVSTSTALGEE